MTVDKEYTQQLEALAEAALTPAPRPSKAMNPTTGELLELATAPTDVLAEQYREISNFVQNGARAFQRAVADELLARGDAEATWTVHAGHWVVEMDGPGRTEFPDGKGLYMALFELVKEGVVSQVALDKAVETEMVYKPRKSGLNALRKLGGRVAGVLAQFEQPVAKPRSVRVKEAGR